MKILQSVWKAAGPFLPGSSEEVPIPLTYALFFFFVFNSDCIYCFSGCKNTVRRRYGALTWSCKWVHVEKSWARRFMFVLLFAVAVAVAVVVDDVVAAAAAVGHAQKFSLYVCGPQVPF